MSLKRTRTEATVAEKLELLEKFKKLPKMSEWKAAKELNVKRGFLRGVIQNEEKIRAEVAQHQDALKDWYKMAKPRLDPLNPPPPTVPNATTTTTTTTTTEQPIPQSQISYNDFKPSNGWLSRWKVRYGLEWPQQVVSKDMTEDLAGSSRGHTSLKTPPDSSDGDATTKLGCRNPLKSTSKLCDEYKDSIRVVDPAAGFSSYGSASRFAGKVVTIKCFEDNSRIREVSKEIGSGRVLVVDGGGSPRRALIGEDLAMQLLQSRWEGLVIYGSICDVDEVKNLSILVHPPSHIPEVKKAPSESESGAEKTDEETKSAATSAKAPPEANAVVRAVSTSPTTTTAVVATQIPSTTPTRQFLGIHALGTCPQKAIKHNEGQIQVPVTFGGVTIYPGDFIVCDNNGIVINSAPMKIGWQMTKPRIKTDIAEQSKG